jgi:Right handed beta helix region
LALERCEERFMLSVFTVTTNSDAPQGGSLRAAITAVNADSTNPGVDTIDFNLPANELVIDLVSSLPTLSHPVLIDGTSQPNYAFGSTMVQVNGSGSGGGNGITLGSGSDGSTIQGLDLVGFATGAAVLVDSTGDTVAANYLGLTTTGTSAANQEGVLVDDAAGAVIGGTTSGAGNVIADSSTAGIEILGTSSTDSTGALVAGNELGANAAGTDLGGNDTAVQIFNAANNTIGGTTAGASSPAANVIGYSTSVGIAVLSGTGNAINANTYEGTNGALQTPSVAASDIGLGVGANGGIQPPQVISAALSADGSSLGLALSANVSAATVLDVYEYSQAQREFLGETTIAQGTSSGSLPVTGLIPGNPYQIVATQSVAGEGTSAFSGLVTVEAASVVTNTNTSGPGSLAGAISAAAAGGGTDITFDIPTGPFTISVPSALQITVPLTIDGTTQLTSQNLPAIVLDINSGATSGLDLQGGGSTIRGLQLTGQAGFTGPDILVASGQNTIGGTILGAGNVVSSSGSTGVSIAGASNVVLDNFIGTNSTGTDLGNAEGVIIDDVASNTLSGNVIGFSSSAGVSISGASASLNVLEGNLIGTNAAGANLGNGLGVVIDGASNNTVGGTAVGAGNTIAFNRFDASHGALTVNVGTGNTILSNLFYGNTGTTIPASGIDLTGTPIGNDNLAAPVITSVSAAGSDSANVTLNVTGMTAGTYTLDVFASAPGDAVVPGQVDAHLHLATIPNITISAGQQTLSETISTSLSGGQQVTATWTFTGTTGSGLTNGDTSEFSATAGVPQPFVLVVTTVQDNGNNTSPTVGSLRQAIENANNNPGALNTITFDITSGSLTINLTAPLPTVTSPVLINGTTEPGFNPTNPATFVTLSGGNTVADGLTLGSVPGATSNGSAIQGLAITGFTDAGILVQTSNNTIGGTTPGPSNSILQANIISGNTSVSGSDGDGVLIDTGTGDAIRGNSIFDNAQGIVLINGGNGSQPAPTIDAVNSTVGTTLIQGQLTGFATNSPFVVEFFSGAPAPLPQINGQQYLGSTQVTTNGSSAMFSVSLPVTVPAGQVVTATATSAAGDTSAFATAQPLADPFDVTTTADSGVGSLRQVITNINNIGASSPTEIEFKISGISPFVISLASALPSIIVPVDIDGTTESTFLGSPAVVQINGAAVTGDGLTLANGSGSNTPGDGSTIIGLSITGFNGNGVVIDTSNNTIGGTTTGLGDTINNNTGDGVLVDGGVGNAIRENSIFGNGGEGIDLVNGGNAEEAAPTLLSAVVTSTNTGVKPPTSTITIQGELAGLVASTVLEFFASSLTDPTGGDQAHTFLPYNPADLTINGDLFTVAITAPSSILPPGVRITATDTPASNDTSPFATSVVESTTFVVTSTGDSGPGTLRQAILAADATDAPSTITFDFDFDPTLFTITLVTPLPQITVPVTMDGTTESEYYSEAQSDTHNPKYGTPVIAIDGATNQIAGDGLTLANGSSGSTIKGMSIYGFASGAGIDIKSNDDTLTADWLGIYPNNTASGYLTSANLEGVLIDGGAANTIGVATIAVVPPVESSNTAITVNGRNLISGNSSSGVVVGNGATDNLLENNFIGTDYSGTTPVPNGGAGVIIEDPGTTGNSIGGTVSGLVNVISGNSSSGVIIENSATGNVVQNSYIGTDSTGTVALQNNGYGVEIDGPSTASNTVGASLAGLVNVISGNSLGGVAIQSGATSNVVQDSYIGIDATGMNGLGNGGPGVVIDASGTVGNGNSVGGTIAGLVNVISDNSSTKGGVVITDGSVGNVVQNSYIGTNATGKGGLPNSGYGVEIDGASTASNTVGASVSGLVNVISGNSQGGVAIQGGASNNVIQGSYIGVDATGSTALANSGPGVLFDDSTGNSVGGTIAGVFNVISDNSSTVGGVVIQNSANGSVVQNSYIGLDATGSHPLGNAGDGVHVASSDSITIGSQVSGLVTAISGNSGDGVSLNSSDNDTIINSYIGTSATGANGNNVFGNQGDGLLILASNNTDVGFYSVKGVNTAAGNVISGNDQDGIQIGNGADTSNATLVLNNEIGTDANGQFAIPNKDYGVLVDTAPGTASTIGGTLIVPSPGVPLQPGTFNVISGNGAGGVELEGQGSNLVAGNLIGTDVTGQEAIRNDGDGIDLIDTAPNTIGGTAADAGNLISANLGAGVSISGAGAAGNDVFGNIIGTNLGETLALGNTGSGIVIDGSSKNLIGSATGSGGNLIAGNLGDGLDILADSSATTVVGNTIGGTAGESASALIGNAGTGILIQDSPDNTIGAAPTQLTAIGTPEQLSALANQVVGNGTDGIFVNISNTVTAAQWSAANTISGNLVARNSHNGIHLRGDLSGDLSLAEISDNLIGTTLDGSSTYDTNANNQPQGNGSSGILLESSSANPAPINGVAATVSGNVISNNGLSGVTVQSAISSSATASILVQDNLIGTDNTGQNVSALSSTSSVLPFGNVQGGIALNNVTGATIGGPASGGSISLALATSGGNLIAGNLGRGIALAGAAADTISANLIGVVLSQSGGQVVVASADPQKQNAGNLSDGIFVLNSVGDMIQGNLVSNNRGYGVHAFANAGQAAIDLLIAGNFIGTNQDGSSAVGLGNGADGVFLDAVSQVTVGGTASLGNVISGNSGDGVDVLEASAILIAGNEIGTNAAGFSAPGSATGDLGNGSNGIFINQSQFVTVGGTTSGAGNTISGNHASGLFISGTVSESGALASSHNLVEGNWIGIGEGTSGPTRVANAVAGIILSNSNVNTIGGSVAGSHNVVSGNSLDGILLVNDAMGNVIEGNEIGTDPTGSIALGNSADGVFLLGSTAVPIKGVPQNTTPSTITGNVIASNVIAGNNQDGVQVFGLGATANTFAQNWIGLSPSGTLVANGADGVILNNAGPMNVVGGAGQGNFISGNNQAGIEITGSPTTTIGTLIEGNLIGTDPSGTYAVANGSYGIQVYNASANTIGGSTTGAGNLIAGNSLAGIQIVNPGGPGAQANNNLMLGNLIGTNIAGTLNLGNGSDGVEVYNASDNTIGGVSTADRNIISGNAGNGILIAQFPGLSASGNQLLGNLIGLSAAGNAAIPNRGNGVELIDGSANTIGGAIAGTTLPNTEVPSATGPGNVISGNGQWGVLVELTSTSIGQTQSAFEGNVIGLDASRTLAIGNGQGGIYVDNVTTQLLGPTIGGSVAGAGNLIAGNPNVGIDLTGPQTSSTGPNDVVQGNLIGLNAAGQVVNIGAAAASATGILLNSSPGDLIGGTSPADRNVISGDDLAGIELVGAISSGDLIAGNLIGTNLAGNAFAPGSTEAAPLESIGVWINGASGDTVGQVGAGNVISGNAVGVQISGVKLSTGQVLGAGNIVAGNLIGTDLSGTHPVSNLDLGVFVNNSQNNTIGPGNVISANGIAGVEIINDGSQRNIVMGNTIGEGAGGQIFSPRGEPILTSNGTESGIHVYADAQLNGVVVIGASSNTIGYEKSIAGSAGNAVSGNVQVGVYISRRDFMGNAYSVPVNNAVSGNTVRSDGIYGILLYDAPNNPVRPFTSLNRKLATNKFGGQEIDFRDYQAGFDAGTSLPPKGSTVKHRTKAVHVVHRPAAKHVEATATSKQHVSESRVLHRARPRVPALFESRAKR